MPLALGAETRAAAGSCQWRESSGTAQACLRVMEAEQAAPWQVVYRPRELEESWKMMAFQLEQEARAVKAL